MLHLGFELFELWVDGFDLTDCFRDIYFFLFFKGINIAGDVEIVIVFFDFIEIRDVREFLDFFSLGECIDDLIGVFFGESVLRLTWLEFLRSFDKQDVFIVFSSATFFASSVDD